MFCKWCGNKITNNGVPCPKCGREQNALENGVGFWDLCDIEPQGKKEKVFLQTPTVSIEAEGNESKAHQNVHKKVKKPAQKNTSTSAVLLCALLVAIIALVVESSITLVQISRYRDRLDSVTSDLYGMKNSVSKGVSELEEYIDNAVSIFTEPSSEDVEDAVTSEEDEPALNLDSAILRDDGEIFIDSYDIQTPHADKVLIVGGIPTENSESTIIWQQYDMQAEEWTDISENQLYILVSEGDELIQIRVLCVIHGQDGQPIVYSASYLTDATREEDAFVNSSDEDSDMTQSGDEIDEFQDLETNDYE